ncbi:MAG: hypothetical protein R3E89_06395 [Thiolinea sp.]
MATQWRTVHAFPVFDLAEAILAQDIKRLQHIVHILHEEETALPLLVWALAVCCASSIPPVLTSSTGGIKSGPAGACPSRVRPCFSRRATHGTRAASRLEPAVSAVGIVGSA